jgi:hypothetical protein
LRGCIEKADFELAAQRMGEVFCFAEGELELARLREIMTLMWDNLSAIADLDGNGRKGSPATASGGTG